MTIWKYKITPEMDTQYIKMPIGATILSFGLDGDGELCFWALVNPSAQLWTRNVACVGTGWHFLLDNGARFVGTTTQGPYVWHLFDLGEVYND